MCKPIKSRIVSLFTEQNDLMFAVPGGLIGVGTKIDPTLCRGDRMTGQVLGSVGTLPDILTDLEISFFLLRRLLGVWGVLVAIGLVGATAMREPSIGAPSA